MSRATVSEIPFPPGLVVNVPWVDERQRCQTCGDDGTVLVGYSQAGTEEAAPCPRCQLGWMAEYGYGSQVQERKNAPGRRVFYRDSRRPWPDGYWPQHRELEAALVAQADSPPLERAENRRRWGVLTRMLAAGQATDQLVTELFGPDEEGLRQAHGRLATDRRMAVSRARTSESRHRRASPMKDIPPGSNGAENRNGGLKATDSEETEPEF